MMIIDSIQNTILGCCSISALDTEHDTSFTNCSTPPSSSANEKDHILCTTIMPTGNTDNVLTMHHAPRFGHTSNLSKLASIHKEERQDYKTGVISFSVFIIFFFLLWLAHLLTLKCKGKERVGCAAGQVYQQEADLFAEQRATRRLIRLRCCFLVCICGIFLSCAVLLGRAVPTTLDATTTLRELNLDMQAVVYEGIEIGEAAKRAQKQLKRVDMDILANATSFCPQSDDEFLDMSKSLQQALVNITTTKDQLESYMATAEQDGTHSDLQTLLDATLSFEDALEWVMDNDWTAKLHVLMLCVLSFFFLYGLCLLPLNKSNAGVQCFMGYVIVPLFATVIVGGSLFAGATSAATIINADFCSGGEYPGSPEGTVQAVLREQGHVEGDVIWDAFAYYKNECIGVVDPFDFLKEDADNVVVALSSVSAVESYVAKIGLDVVNKMCGADITPLLKNTMKVSKALDTVLGGLRRSIDITSCRRVSPIYRRVFRGPTCNESVRGLTNIFACLVAICVFGMTLISVRAALYTRDCPEHDDAKEDELGQANEEEQDEFEQYQHFLSRFYNNGAVWKDGEEDKKKKNENDDDNDGANIVAVGTFETQSCEELESWDEDENEEPSDSIFRRVAGSPTGRSTNDEELTPLTPPTTFTFSSPSVDDRIRPATSASC